MCKFDEESKSALEEFESLKKEALYQNKAPRRF